MKTIRQTIMWLAIAMGCTSCSSLFYDVKTDVLHDIHQGMSRQEVTALLGKPKYRRFDLDLEEWEYNKNLSKSGYTTIIVSFEGDKVFALNSFPGSRPATPSVTVTSGDMMITTPATECTPVIHPENFQAFYEKVKSRPFKDDQLEMMGAFAAKHRLNCRQCARLMSLYTFDDDKMKVLRIFASGLTDRDNYTEILDVISSLFKKDDAKKLINPRRF